MNLKQQLIYRRDLMDLFRRREVYRYKNLTYVNFWADAPKNFWFSRMMDRVFPGTETPVRFTSVFGPRKDIERPFDGKTVFFTGENVEPRKRFPALHEREEKALGWQRRMEAFEDYGKGHADLRLGFGHHGDPDYYRLPFWVTRYFEPEDTLPVIRKKLDVLEHGVPFDPSRKGAAMIASHDFFGTRAFICGLTDPIVPVEYAGTWRHNSDRLRGDFGDDKAAYLRSVRFNICAENMDADGYVTEKLFDAFAANAIPVYHGDGNRPEPGILNPDAILFADFEGDNGALKEKLTRLNEDDAAYRAFLEQPKFLPGAAEKIDGILSGLRERMEEVLRS